MKETTPHRIDVILNMVKQGKSPEEIDYVLGYRSRALERGNLSEKYVYLALKNYPGIKNIRICSKNKNHDNKGRDIFVELEEPLMDDNVHHVFIQVKSSLSGINTFIREVCERGNIQLSEAERWLIENNLIILNGRLNAPEIVKDFLTQLENIKKRRSPPFVQ